MTRSASSTAPEQPIPSVGRIALLVGGLVSLTIVGSSAVAVALPVLERDLGLDTAGSSWVLAAFSLSFSVATVLFGRLADLHGLRRPLWIGVSLLTVGSIAAALAWSFPSLVAGRLVQGAGAGAIPVLAVGILSARFSGPRRTHVLGVLGAMVAVVSGSGPLIGGAVSHVLGWRAVVAVPALALLLTVSVARIAPRAPAAGPGRHRTLDWPGALLVGFAAAAFALLLQTPATGAGWAAVAGFGGAALVGTVATVGRSRAVPDGFLPWRLITNTELVLVSFAGLTILAGYLGALFVLPKILTAEQGWTPLQIGLALLPPAMFGALVSRLVGRMAPRFGRLRVAWLLGLGSGAGLLLAAGAHARPAALMVGMAGVAAAFAGGQVALVDTIPLLVDPADQGGGLGIFNLFFFTGGALGAAIVGGFADALTLPGALALLAALPLGGAVAAAVARRRCRDRAPTPAPASAGPTA